MRESASLKWLEDHKNYPHDYCLIWPFSRHPDFGRGTLGYQGRSAYAHRVMCEMVNGQAPIDRPQAAHSCGNGDQGCVNPRHLSWASNSENQTQRYEHGRGVRNAKGAVSMFTAGQIEEIRSKYGEFTQMKLAEMYGCSLGTIQYYLKYREQRGHAGGAVDHWKPEEDALLRQLIDQGKNFTQISKQIGRSVGATSSRTYRLGLKSGQPSIPKKIA